MITKLKIYGTIGALIVVAAIGLQYLNPRSESPRSERDKKDGVMLTVVFRPEYLPQEDSPVLIEVHLSTGPYLKWNVRTPWPGHLITLRPGESVTLTAFRYTLKYLGCKIHDDGIQVSYDNEPELGRVYCHYVKK